MEIITVIIVSVAITDAPRTERRETRDEASTRDRLVAAALDVFRTHGYEGARVSEIARVAGMTTGAIYGNYRGKAELLLDAIATGTGAEIDALAGATSAAGSRHLLEVLGTGLMDRRSGDLPLLAEAIVASRRDPELARLLRERFDERRTRLATIVETAKNAGAIDPDLSTDALASFCRTLALGALVARTLDLPTPDRDDWGVLIARLLDAVSPESKGTE